MIYHITSSADKSFVGADEAVGITRQSAASKLMTNFDVLRSIAAAVYISHQIPCVSQMSTGFYSITESSNLANNI